MSEVRDLHAEIGQQSVQNDFLSHALDFLSREDRIVMVDRSNPKLSLSAQCRVLRLDQTSLYYRRMGDSAATLALMRRIDELFMASPLYGSRQMVRQHQMKVSH